MKRLKKSICILANFSLLLNNFLPLIIFAKPAYAVEETLSEVVQETPTPETTPIVENNEPVETTPTPETNPTPEITPEATVTPEVVVTPETTPIISPIIIEPTPTVEATPTAQITPTITADQPTSVPENNPNQNQNPATPTSTPESTPEVTPTITPTVTMVSPSLVLPIEGEIETVVVPINQSRTDLLNPTLSSDKEDYAPTEMAIITGNNFIPNAGYLLVITSDGLNETYNITTDTEGKFTYSYQLDGNYRPVYQVVIKDQSNQEIASMSFLDHQNFSVRINNGADYTTSQNVSVNMSWETPLLNNIDPTYVRFVTVSSGADCPWSINSSWSDWESVSDAGGNTATKSWQLRSTVGAQRVCVQTAHGLKVLIETAFDEIEYRLPDTTPPETTIVLKPNLTTSSSQANFTFTSNETNSTFQCKIDGETYSSCTSPKSYSDLLDGVHNFYVKATDSSNNIDLTPSVYSWTVDTVGPEITIAPYSTDPTNQDIIVTASVTEGSLNFSSHIFTQNGYFDFVATDDLGNISTKRVTVSNIDKTNPTASVSYSDTDITNQSVVATLTNPSESITVLGNGSWTHTFDQNGSYTFDFVDGVGNSGAVTATVTNIDKTLPVVTFGQNNPTGLTNKNDQTFTVSVNELAKTCKINFAGNYVERQIENGLSDGAGFSYIVGGDDTGTYYTLPFPFSFYGNYYNQVGISTNGLIRFNSLNTSYPGSVDQLRSQTAITPFWQDIVTSVYAQSSANDVRFRWTGYGWGTGGSLTGETVLRSSGQVEFHYGNVNLPSRPITAGISSGNTTDYVLSSTNGQSYISPVSFAYAPGFEGTYDMVKGEDGIYSVTVEDITDGNVTYSVTCTDLANNEGKTESKSFIVDTQAPTLSSKTEFSDTWYSTDQISEFVFSDPNNVVSGNNPTCTISTEGPQQTCTVNDLNVCDAAGNCNIDNVTSDGANIDKAFPIINLSVSPENPDADNGWYKTRPSVTAQASDANLSGFFYQWDSTAGSWTEYTSSLSTPTEGVHVLYLKAIDLAGNFTQASQTLKWDQTDPELGPQNISADPNPTSGSTSKIKWEFAKDNVGIDKYEIKWKLNGIDNSTEYSKTVGAGTTEVEVDQLTEGRWTVRVIAFDQSGHQKDNAIDLIVDRSGPSAPTLTLNSVGAGIASLSWTLIEDARDYIIWYGNNPDQYLYGARVGNVTSYTVQGLGAGNYYFIVKAVDGAQNQSSNSNEVNTGNIIGAAGTVPNQPAEGFTPEVKGESTEEPSPSNNPIEKILGIGSENGGFNWWWLLLLLIPTYFVGRKLTKKKK